MPAKTIVADEKYNKRYTYYSVNLPPPWNENIFTSSYSIFAI